jgi:hypothetical protein
MKTKGTRMRWFVLPLALVGLLLAGCGGGGEEGGAQQGDGSAQTRAEKAVTDTIATWMLERRCELATDKYLEAQVGLGDSRRENCEFVRQTFTKPAYGRDDIKFSNVKITGSTATATVGDYHTNVTADYKLVLQGGRWRIDESD